MENKRYLQGGVRRSQAVSWKCLPSGKRLQFAIENGHRNSGFSHSKMVDLSTVMWLFTRGYCFHADGSKLSFSFEPMMDPSSSFAHTPHTNHRKTQLRSPDVASSRPQPRSEVQSHGRHVGLWRPHVPSDVRPLSVARRSKPRFRAAHPRTIWDNGNLREFLPPLGIQPSNLRWLLQHRQSNHLNRLKKMPFALSFP